MKVSPPAFPTWIESDSVAHGMTLRDYFAAAALTGLLSDLHRIISHPETFADDAYQIADAMMKAREQ
jgi:hypothetical protein